MAHKITFKDIKAGTIYVGMKNVDEDGELLEFYLGMKQDETHLFSNIVEPFTKQDFGDEDKWDGFEGDLFDEDNFPCVSCDTDDFTSTDDYFDYVLGYVEGEMDEDDAPLDNMLYLYLWKDGEIIYEKTKKVDLTRTSIPDFDELDDALILISFDTVSTEDDDDEIRHNSYPFTYQDGELLSYEFSDDYESTEIDEYFDPEDYEVYSRTPYPSDDYVNVLEFAIDVLDNEGAAYVEACHWDEEEVVDNRFTMSIYNANHRKIFEHTLEVE